MSELFFDVVVVGAASAGSYFARNMAKKGLKVLMIERHSEDKVGSKYDIFHVPTESFDEFDLPRPTVEDGDYAFAFNDTVAHSPDLKWARCAPNHVVGMHMHPYMLRLNRWAKEAGVQVEYNAAFKDLLLDDGNKVCGIVYEQEGKQVAVKANLVADASGWQAVARRALPDGCVVENFALAPETMHHVVLRYAVYEEPREARVVSCNWRHYGVWEAPSGNPRGSILGAAAKGSYEKAEKVFERFNRCVPMPAFTVEKKEYGVTPYCRMPYSMVCDGFVALGDTACINRINGEGVTFAMVQSNIVMEIAAPYLLSGKRPTTEELWPINRQYHLIQGAGFLSQKALILARPSWNTQEDTYVYLTDIFRMAPQVFWAEKGKPFALTDEERASIREKAITEGGLAPEKVDQQLFAMDNADAVLRHYLAYPETPEGFESWKEAAGKLWANCPDAGH